MPQDLRTYLASLENEIARVGKTVDCRYEIPCLLQRLEDEKRFPILICDSVLDTQGEVSGMPVLANLFASRRRLSRVLGADDRGAAAAYHQRSSERIPVRFTDEAPVKEVRKVGDEVDLRRLPIITHHEGDGGAYLTSGVVLVKDPETGVVNGAIQRMQLKGERALGIYMVRSGHNWQIFEKYRALGRDMPVAIVLGHHPAFFLGMQHKGSLDDSEYEVVGSLLGEGLAVTPAETLDDLEIPARAEIVLEGRVLHDLEEAEGPFGEYTHYYSPVEDHNRIEISAVLHRRDALFHDIFAGHRDHHFLEGLVMEGQLITAVRRRFPQVSALSLPPSGCCQFYCYVSVAKGSDDEPQEIARTILAEQIYIKYVVVVDEDIDVFNEEEVLWAIATRSRLSRDLRIHRDLPGTDMDPTAGSDGPERAGLDATWPLAAEPKERIALPREVLQGVRLEDYDL